MSRSFIKTNSQALRWCQTRRATIQFNSWRECSEPAHAATYLPEGISCRITLGGAHRFGKTLTKAVNAWIQNFNEQEKK